MVALLYRMPAGIPGDVNRAQHHTVEAQVITPSGTTGHPTSYGIPVVLDPTTHQIRGLASTDIAAMIYGLLVRPFPAVASLDPVGVATPPLSGPCDVLRRGYMPVRLSGSAAAVKNGQAYAWIGASSGSHIQGNIEAVGATPTAAGVATPGNTGNSTMSAVTTAGPAQTVGNYSVVYTSATAFNVYAPNGDLIGTGVNGTPFTSRSIGFTMTTGGTAMVAGDSFTVAAVASTLQLPAVFMGPADANGITEVAYNL